MCFHQKKKFASMYMYRNMSVHLCVSINPKKTVKTENIIIHGPEKVEQGLGKSTEENDLAINL